MIPFILGLWVGTSFGIFMTLVIIYWILDDTPHTE